MKIRYSRQCHIRTIGGESLLWHNLTFAAMLLQDAEAFLAPITREWRECRNIVQAVAEACQAPVEEVEADFMDFLRPLARNGLVEIDAKMRCGDCQTPVNAAGPAVLSNSPLLKAKS